MPGLSEIFVPETSPRIKVYRLEVHFNESDTNEVDADFALTPCVVIGIIPKGTQDGVFIQECGLDRVAAELILHTVNPVPDDCAWDVVVMFAR